jgi:hypothetical protein
MNAITLANAARWNLETAERVAKRGNKREAARLRANARRCLERLKDPSHVDDRTA